jgi:flagellar hook-associated protein 1 FlgK
MFGQTPSTAPSITAANITLLISDPNELAAAAVSPTAAGGVTSGDGGNADAMFQQRLTTTGVDATYRKMIVASGVETATASGNLATQTVVSSNVDSARDSVAGVSTDEEMTNMLQFQHGYQAAGKLVETINSMLDDLMAMVN